MLADNDVACAPAAVASAQFVDISDDDDDAAEDDADDHTINAYGLSILVRLPLRDAGSAASSPGALCCGRGGVWRMMPHLWF